MKLIALILTMISMSAFADPTVESNAGGINKHATDIAVLEARIDALEAAGGGGETGAPTLWLLRNAGTQAIRMSNGGQTGIMFMRCRRASDTNYVLDGFFDQPTIIAQLGASTNLASQLPDWDTCFALIPDWVEYLTNGGTQPNELP